MGVEPTTLRVQVYPQSDALASRLPSLLTNSFVNSHLLHKPDPANTSGVHTLLTIAQCWPFI